MKGFFSKIARFAVSKMAAFCYAVAVGVAGNLVFHFVQTHDAVPSVAALHREAPAPTDPAPRIAPASLIVAKPPAASPVAPAKPAALPATPAPLPEAPTAINLPNPAAMSAPPLKPAALPPTPAPAETAAPATTSIPAGETASAPAALPPLGPAIEVAVPPGSPVAAHSAPIPLVPDAKSPPAEVADKPQPAAKPGAPGPGSGGLY